MEDLIKRQHEYLKLLMDVSWRKGFYAQKYFIKDGLHKLSKWWWYDQPGAEPIDYWDYHTGGPVINGSTVYAGLGNGYVYGFDITTGNISSKFATADTVPVRSGLVIENSILYFGVLLNSVCLLIVFSCSHKPRCGFGRPRPLND